MRKLDSEPRDDSCDKEDVGRGHDDYHKSIEDMLRIVNISIRSYDKGLVRGWKEGFLRSGDLEYSRLI